MVKPIVCGACKEKGLVLTVSTGEFECFYCKDKPLLKLNVETWNVPGDFVKPKGTVGSVRVANVVYFEDKLDGIKKPFRSLKEVKAGKGYIPPLKVEINGRVISRRRFLEVARRKARELVKKKIKEGLLPPVCVSCGSSDSLTVDHILPFKEGGGNEESNLQLLCVSCHVRKEGSGVTKLLPFKW